MFSTIRAILFKTQEGTRRAFSRLKWDDDHLVGGKILLSWLYSTLLSCLGCYNKQVLCQGSKDARVHRESLGRPCWHVGMGSFLNEKNAEDLGPSCLPFCLLRSLEGPRSIVRIN